MSKLRDIMGEIAKHRAVKSLRPETELGPDPFFKNVLPEEKRKVGRPPIGREDVRTRMVGVETPSPPREVEAPRDPGERARGMAAQREGVPTPFEPGTPTQRRIEHDDTMALEREKMALQERLARMAGAGGAGGAPGVDMDELADMPGDREIMRPALEELVRTAVGEGKTYQQMKRMPEFANTQDALIDAGFNKGDIEDLSKRAYASIANDRAEYIRTERVPQLGFTGAIFDRDTFNNTFKILSNLVRGMEQAGYEPSKRLEELAGLRRGTGGPAGGEAPAGGPTS